MRAVRFALIATLCLLALANAVHFFQRTDSARLASAIGNDTIHPSEQTRWELREATTAAHRRFVTEEAVFAGVFLVLSAGIAFATIEIRKRTC